MGTRLTIGHSGDCDASVAARAAVGSALEGATNPSFALVMSTDCYDPVALARALRESLGSVPWAACCSAGVFAGVQWIPDGLVVGVISSPDRDARVGVGISGPIEAAPRIAGADAVADALSHLGPADPRRERSIILLPDGRAGVAADVVRGAAREVGADALWVGGGSGHNTRPLRSVQFAGGESHSDRVVAIALESRRKSGVGICHGWTPFGKPTMVTRARGDTILELDYQPAFRVYQQCAASRGDRVTPETFASFAISHPIGIPQPDEEYVIRDPLELLPDGGIRCVGEVPDGALVRMMKGDAEALLSAASKAARHARERVEGVPAGAIAFDCVSRRVMLGERTRDELMRFQDGVGRDVPMMGCLTFGEIGTLTHGMPQFHNKTAVLLALPA
jgi:hypothetical protein